MSGSVSELLGGVMRLWSLMMGRASVNDGQLWRALANSAACLGGDLSREVGSNGGSMAWLCLAVGVKSY